MALKEASPPPIKPASVKAAQQPQGLAAQLGDRLRQNFRQYGMFTALIIIVLLFQVWTQGILLRPLNVTNLIQQNSYILLLAIGMVIVIIAGHIDLSVGSVAAFVGAISAVLMVEHHVPFPIALVLCLLLGAAIGAWQGFWIAYIGIPSFIVTLAGMLLFRGATQIALQGQSIAPFPTEFQRISNGFIPAAGPYTDFHNPTLAIGLLFAIAVVFFEMRRRRAQAAHGFDLLPLPWFLLKVVAMVAFIAAFTFNLASYQGIPVVGLVLLALFTFYSFVMSTTVLGRHAYATGGNQAAARLSGIKTKRISLLVFMNMGVLAALAGLVYAARLNAGTPNAGINFELEAIAAAFIGGASTSGGIGTVFGALVGGLVLGVLNNGMSLIGLGTDVQQVIKGLVLLMAVGFDVYNKKRGGS